MHEAPEVERLLDIRDEVSIAKHFVACVFLAAQAPMLPASERAALCAVSNAARERLEAVEGALDLLIAGRRDAD